MALIVAFGLHLRQLDAVNAFLNAANDEVIYCQMPDGYKLNGKVLRVVKALYGQRKSPLLWLRLLSKTCLEMGLQQIPGEPCLFTNGNGVFLFFYVDDIIIAYMPAKRNQMEEYVRLLKGKYEMKDLGVLKFFLGARIIHEVEKGTLSLVQDDYLNKIAKEYDILTSTRTPKIPLPLASELVPFLGPIDESRRHEYRKKWGLSATPP